MDFFFIRREGNFITQDVEDISHGASVRGRGHYRAQLDY
jgi:hypothetical protein